MADFFIKRLGVFDPDLAQAVSAAIDNHLNGAAPYRVVTLSRETVLHVVPELMRPAVEEVVGPTFGIARVPPPTIDMSSLHSWCAEVERRYGCCLGIRNRDVFGPWQESVDGLAELRFVAVGAEAPNAIEDLVKRVALSVVTV